jgi:fatty acid desaturase
MTKRPNDDSVQSRDYSLDGPENAQAVDAGLAHADWYRTPISRKRMKELMQRADGPATRDTLLWLGGLVMFGALGAQTWGSWWCAPFFFVYGVLYGSGGDSRWHECGHGTAFKTPWKNDAVYHLASFMMMRNPVIWRWSHARHHTDTIIVGRDPEIVAMRPPRLIKILLNVFGLVDVPQALARMIRHAAGSLTGEERDFVPETERPKVYRIARIWLAIYGATALACLATASVLPAMLVGLPRFYGAWHHLWTGLTQHAGLAEDVLDHRLNSRTVYMNPVSRFIYWNMNYHVEHHMFPMVPYHRLPDLHAEIKHDCPPAYPGMYAAYREIVPAILRQLQDVSHFVRRELPPGARTIAPGAVSMAAE